MEDAYLLTHDSMSHRAMGAQLGRTQGAVKRRVRQLHKKSRNGAVVNPSHGFELDTKQAGTILDSGR
jgi:hypothetical protein